MAVFISSALLISVGSVPPESSHGGERKGEESPHFLFELASAFHPAGTKNLFLLLCIGDPTKSMLSFSPGGNSNFHEQFETKKNSAVGAIVFYLVF